MNAFRKGNRKGFTMIELMVVVIIVGVLAAIAIPLYGKYVKNARITEATGRMGEIITAAKAYATENEALDGTKPWPTVAEGQTVGLVDCSPSENFTYRTSGTTADQPLIVYARGTTTRMAGVTVVITVENINRTGSAPVITGM